MTNTDPDDHNRPEREHSLIERVVHANRRAGVFLGSRVRHTAEWAREQDRSMLAWFLGIAAVAVLLAYVTLRVLFAFVGGLWSMLFGGDVTEQPAPPPSSPPAPADDGPPQWVAVLDRHPLWTDLWNGVAGWFEHQADLTGVPMLVLLIGWAAAGALLLLAAWFRDSLAEVVPWWAWLATTCWLVWLHTPGSSPIPAAVVGTVGTVASSNLLFGLLITLASVGFGTLVALN